jgi:hypothetical protein
MKIEDKLRLYHDMLLYLMLEQSPGPVLLANVDREKLNERWALEVAPVKFEQSVFMQVTVRRRARKERKGSGAE